MQIYKSEMSIDIKGKDEIEKMRNGGEILAQIMSNLLTKVDECVSTQDIENEAEALFKSKNVIPAFKGYKGYPAIGCFGLNDVVVHGFPSDKDILKEGDILSIDMGLIYEGYYADMAVTKGIGTISENAERLINSTSMALKNAITRAKAGNTIGDIGSAIQSTVELSGFSVVKQMVGHGIGKALHEEPQIPGYGVEGEGIKLEEGMTLAIEAIINEGESDIVFEKDGWTTRTRDGKLSALFEHTVLVRKKDCSILKKI